LVDGNGIVPLSLLGPAESAAAHLRPRIHTQFAEAWAHRAATTPDVPRVARSTLEPPFTPWDTRQENAAALRGLDLDSSVPPVVGVTGGSVAGQSVLRSFVAKKLGNYAGERNQPDAPERNSASGLSAYLRYGHLAIQEVAEGALGADWTPAEINPRAKGKREDYYCRDANVNAFLDEAMTWRDVGYHWHFVRNVACSPLGPGARPVTWQSLSDAASRPHFNFETFDFSPGGERTLDVVLPDWAKATLRKHASDRREHLYSLAEFESASTHDELWNAAQRELVATGRIHNYLRMLWAKKVLEWSESPAVAYQILEHLNNKYALDGRDPNSYTGILWCFGLFDHPWPPERPVLGTLRYMSSDNTAKKFRLAGYFEYIRSLPTPATTSGGPAASRSKLF
jgi:deoxyribodipyrimidine photo-lyase